MRLWSKSVLATESWKTHHSQNGVEADTDGKAGDGPSGDKHRVIDQLAHHGFEGAGGKAGNRWALYFADASRYISGKSHVS